MDLFSDIHKRHQSNSADKWQHYLDVYDEALLPYQQQAVNVLEIGVFNGGSLEVWADYFPQAQHIIGCDINPKCQNIEFGSDKIDLVLGDVKQVNTLEHIQAIASEFDIIIDDGSHTSFDIIATFVRLFPLLKDGGLYIIEDLHCSYWAGWQGGINRADSSMQFLKKLADVVNFEHWDVNAAAHELFQAFPAAAGLEQVGLDGIFSIQFSNSLCLIRKRPVAKNRLGVRCVSGQIFAVNDEVKAVQGQPMSMPQAKQNISLLDETIPQLQAQIHQQQVWLQQQQTYIQQLTQHIQSLQDPQQN